MDNAYIGPHPPGDDGRRYTSKACLNIYLSRPSTNVTYAKFLKRRLPPKNAPGGMFNPKVFKSLPFTVYCFSSLVTFLGLYTGSHLPHYPYVGYPCLRLST